MPVSARYQRILGLFIAIGIIIALIVWGIVLISGSEAESIPGWESSTQDGYVFEYPSSLNTTYIHPVDWPPRLEVFEGPFTCLETLENGGKTELRTIGERNYCVTETTEGAAGSIYTQYAYVFPQGNNVLIFTFTLRATQCGNYPEEEMAACTIEREAFKVDVLIDTIAQTIK